jgi:protein TonB
LIAGGVVLLHGAGLWALQSGLLARAVEVVVPVEAIAELLAPPKPIDIKLPPPPPPAASPRAQQTPPPPAPAPTPAVQTTQAAPSPAAISAPPAPPVLPSQPPAPAVAAAPAAATPGPAAPPAPVTAPSSDAAHLNNPAPAYPSVSRRLGEEGRVVLRVYVLADGTAGEVQVRTSSGYERLDQAAVDAVKRWRFVPAKRGTEPVAAWYLQPINFSLNN